MLKRYTFPFIVGLVVMFFGSFVVTYFNFYNTFSHLDKILHISGGFIVSWFFTRLWLGKLDDFNRFEYIILCIALAAMIGFFWEMMEYIGSVSSLFNYSILHRYIYIGSLTDTLGDLLADIFGAALFGLLSRRV